MFVFFKKSKQGQNNREHYGHTQKIVKIKTYPIWKIELKLLCQINEYGHKKHQQKKRIDESFHAAIMVNNQAIKVPIAITAAQIEYMI